MITQNSLRFSCFQYLAFTSVFIFILLYSNVFVVRHSTFFRYYMLLYLQNIRKWFYIFLKWLTIKLSYAKLS